ncbi:MAG: leucyl aminopeptidase family protein [Pseudomonadota bacterium]
MHYDNLIQPDNGQAATLIHLTDKSRFATWLAIQSDAIRTAVKAQKFEGSPNDIAILPGEKPSEWSVVAGVSDAAEPGVWHLAKAADSLPEGTYRLADYDASEAMLGWMLGQYRYHEYLSEPKLTGPRILLVKEPARIHATALQAAATALVRDLVNRPAGDLGPNALEAEAKRIAKAHKAEVTVTAGEALETGYPLIHAVGKAAMRDHAPRLIEIEWGDPRHPRIAIVGKGITFDSGGLDIKPASGMRLMKKDMGGAAHALALAELIMAAHLPVRLHMLVAAAENSIAGNAMRPGDIIKSRKGITVEIDNTDAEGRLVLADALTKAIEDKPEMIVDFATLTGAARVALGPDLPAMFSNDDGLANALLAASKSTADPLWRMPLWAPYMEMLDSDIADTSNSGGAFAGSVTAALFLQKFVPDNVPWVHLDTFAWRPTNKPGRPKGGEALGLRAVFGYLAETYPAR